MTETFERVDAAGIKWRVTIDRLKGLITETRVTPRASRPWNGRDPEDVRRVYPLTALEPTSLDADGQAILRVLRTSRPPHRDAAIGIAMTNPGSDAQRAAAVDTYLKHYL